MLKKLILTGLGFLAFTSASLAKDGPFPMYGALGIWESNNSYAIQVDIRAGNRFGRYVDVMVVIRSSRNGQLLAQGTAHHDLESTELQIVMNNAAGSKTLMTLVAVYNSKETNSCGCDFHLVMSERIVDGVNEPDKEIVLLRPGDPGA